MEKPTGRHTGRWQCNGRITQTHLLKLNGRVPRMSLWSSFWRDLLYTAASLPKKGKGLCITQIFIPEENIWQIAWAMAHTTFWNSLWHILHHRMSTLVHNIPAWKYGQESHHGENGSCVTKTKGLGNAYAHAKKVSHTIPGKTPLHLYNSQNTSKKPKYYLFSTDKLQETIMHDWEQWQKVTFLFRVETNTEGIVGVCKGPLLDSFSEHKDALCAWSIRSQWNGH